MQIFEPILGDKSSSLRKCLCLLIEEDPDLRSGLAKLTSDAPLSIG